MDRITPILEAVAALFEVTVTDVCSKQLARKVTHARQAAIWVLYQRYPQYSLCRIGAYVGIKDHSTVVFALRQIEKRMRADPWLDVELRALAAIPRTICVSRPALRWWGPTYKPLAA